MCLIQAPDRQQTLERTVQTNAKLDTVSTFSRQCIGYFIHDNREQNWASYTPLSKGAGTVKRLCEFSFCRKHASGESYIAIIALIKCLDAPDLINALKRVSCWTES